MNVLEEAGYHCGFCAPRAAAFRYLPLSSRQTLTVELQLSWTRNQSTWAGPCVRHPFPSPGLSERERHTECTLYSANGIAELCGHFGSSHDDETALENSGLLKSACPDIDRPVVFPGRSTMLSGAFRQCVSVGRVVLKPQHFRPLLVGGRIHPSLTWHPFPAYL